MILDNTVRSEYEIKIYQFSLVVEEGIDEKKNGFLRMCRLVCFFSDGLI